MAYTLSPYILKSAWNDAPLAYKWLPDSTLKFYESENGRLSEAIRAIHFRAKMALATAIMEWIVARFQKVTSTDDAMLRIEACWAASIDPRYAKRLSMHVDFDPDVGPFSLAIILLGEITDFYSEASQYIDLVALINVAKHVVAKPKSFEKWLETAIKDLSAEFPMDLSHYDRASKVYDDSYEEPVPALFFDPSAVVKRKHRPRLIKAFIATLDPKENPYLNTAETMNRLGFERNPYVSLA